MRATGRISLGWLCACAALVLGVAAALASPPRIDGGFGVDGIASTSFPPEADIEPFEEISAAPDGGVITRSGYYSSTELRHYGPDGSLVKAEPELKNGREIALRPPEAPTPEGGRLVGVPAAEEGPNVVALYGADGSLDPSFGKGGTSESLPFEVQAVASLPAGKVLVAGKGILQPGGTKNVPTFQVYVARLGVDGKLDPSFGKAGIVKLQSEDKVPGEEALVAVGRQGEGAEVAVASTVVGLDSSGNLDPGFGKGGRAATPGPAIGATAAAGEALLVAGTKPTEPSGGEDEAPEGLYVARFTAAGKLDPTFAGGSGVTLPDPEDEATADTALFAGDGSVTVGGTTHRAAGCAPGYSCDNTPVVARVTPDGLPDTAFGTGGVARLSSLTVPIDGGYGVGIAALVARAGGGIFAAGEGLGVAFVAALGTNGSLDPAFGSGGLITRGDTKPSFVSPVASGVDRAGDIYVLANNNSGTALSESAIVLRYSPDGTLDQSYGEGGKAYVASYPESLAVAPDGSVYVSSEERSTLLKLTPSGSLDPGFGKGGVAQLGSVEPFSIGPMTTLPDGDLLLAGSAYPRALAWPAVVRLHPDGKVDRSFGEGGVAMARPPTGQEWQGASAMTVDDRGRIVLGGSVLHHCCRERGALVRFDRDGRLDRSFGHRGTTLFGGRGITSVGGLAHRGDRVLVVTTLTGGHKTRDVLYSFDSKGRLDRRFGDRGAAIVQPRNDSRELFESVSVFSTHERIVVARSYLAAPLVAFSPRGKPEPAVFRHLGNLVPRPPGRSVRAGRAVTLDGNGLIFVSSTYPKDGSGATAKEGELELRRVLLGRS
ncbi:MAG TPA: hypothetical protein VGC32_05255 [Solirubrobacterales bacterium]